MRLMKILVLGSTLCAAVASAQQTAPVPRTRFDGPALTFEFPGLRIGVAEYEEGPTGTTVFHFPDRVMAVVDVRGGAPGTLFTDALRLGNAERRFDGIVFAGGSAYGLAAVSWRDSGFEAVAGAPEPVATCRNHAWRDHLRHRRPAPVDRDA